MVGVSSDFREDVIRVGEAIPDGDSFEASQETACFFSLYDLFGDGGHVLSSIALTEDDQRVGSRNIEVESTKAPFSVHTV